MVELHLLKCVCGIMIVVMSILLLIWLAQGLVDHEKLANRLVTPTTQGFKPVEVSPVLS